MTKFELHNDYRTTAFEALNILGLNQNDIMEATDFHELYHNLTPAKKQLVMAANVMNIRLLDHIVFTDSGYYSYSDEGVF